MIQPTSNMIASASNTETATAATFGNRARCSSLTISTKKVTRLRRASSAPPTGRRRWRSRYAIISSRSEASFSVRSPTRAGPNPAAFNSSCSRERRARSRRRRTSPFIPGVFQPATNLHICSILNSHSPRDRYHLLGPISGRKGDGKTAIARPMPG